MNKLSSWQTRVNEGKDLEPALEFCRYVLWSGIVELCKYHADASNPVLEVSGVNLETKARQLQSDIQERFRRNNTTPTVELSELEKINRKLDLIAGRIAHLSPPARETTESDAQSAPELLVIQGGRI